MVSNYKIIVELNIFDGIKNTTVVCVYKDTLYKDNMAEIWPKPTLFDFGPSLNKDNMAKNSKGSFFQKYQKKGHH
jgi:hypothetical protein